MSKTITVYKDCKALQKFYEWADRVMENINEKN